MTASGIDVSNHNGKLNLTQGLQGLGFVIAKATEGTNFVDSTYNYYQQNTKALNLHFGAYHFLHAENLSGESEALWFLRHANLSSGMSVWIDYETYGLNGGVDTEVISLFAETVKLYSNVKRVGLYANLTGFSRVGPRGIDQACDFFWLADYNNQVETPTAPLAPYGLAWTLHQYEVFNNIDRDYSRVDAAQLTQLFTW
jgi:GH25 family lysozyme M1 (1,4-beta-N-acetylmuramidase)